MCSRLRVLRQLVRTALQGQSREAWVAKRTLPCTGLKVLHDIRITGSDSIRTLHPPGIVAAQRVASRNQPYIFLDEE